MTRVNLVPPSELCDQHLLAEHREITRIPNCVLSGKYKPVGIPDSYRLGTGHVRFFMDKLLFIRRRYESLHRECLGRGFKVKDIFPPVVGMADLNKDYTPTPEALALNRARIAERMPKNARFTPSSGNQS